LTRKRIAVAAIAVLLLIVVAFFAFDNRLMLRKYTVKDSKLPSGFDGYRILFVTDLHCEYFGEGQEEIAAFAEKFAPDAVFFGGDMMDQDLRDFEAVEQLLMALSDYEIYAVWGNHDRWLGRADFTRLQELYARYGVNVLWDDTVILEKNGDKIALSGADDPPSWNNGSEEYLRENGIAVTPVEGMYNVLLFHRANLFDVISDYGFDLVISGHMHGGQVRIPYICGLVSPTRQWFPKYTSGVYQKDGSKLIVGRGLGNSVDFPRIFNPPQLVGIVLEK